MRYSLLDIVQRVLGSMDSDEVNTIFDTPESTEVANIAKECYFDIVGDIGLREHEGLFQLDASGDNTKPCLMTLPTSVIDLYTVEYNQGTILDPEFQPLAYRTLKEFLDIQDPLELDGTSVIGTTLSLNGNDFRFKVFKDRHPTIYTSLDDRQLIFDGYLFSENDTLVSQRTRCFGLLAPAFTMADSFVPILDPRQFQLWLQSTKAQAFVELKQTENPKAERKERRNWILARKTKNNTDPRTGLEKQKGFGRK